MSVYGKKVLAVIPARGGSKRCPRKNARYFRGRRLLAWTAEAAQKSKLVDRLVLSTEDEEIKLIGQALGLEVIDRPAELATDTAACEDVMRHVLKQLPNYDYVVLLQPTSPLRTTSDIDHCLLMTKESDVVISRMEGGVRNGAVYVMHSSLLEKGHNFKTRLEHCAWYAMPAERSLDIDEEWQLES